ncbi:RHS repeat-associated core domain-containing protein [Propionigenium maris]|nr:RHS repeat-associated core domain-containing protein [Propionigenium maris]
MNYIHGLERLPLLEIDENGSVIVNIFDDGELLCIEEEDSESYLLKDHLGSTRVVIDETTEKVGEFYYGDFGKTVTKAEPGRSLDSIRYRYTGQEWDEEVEKYNYLAREYDPVTGRFNNPDPARQGFSPYVYVENNPINFVDPDGRVLTKIEYDAISFYQHIGDNLVNDFLRGTKEIPSDLFERWKKYQVGGQAIGNSILTGDQTELSETSKNIRGFLENPTEATTIISNVLRKETPIRDPLYRGAHINKKSKLYNEIRSYTVGDIVSNRGFLSTSLQEETAKNFASPESASASCFSKQDKGIMFQIESSTGVNISLLKDRGHQQGENEVLFAPDTLFEITNIQKSKDYTRIKIKEVFGTSSFRKVKTLI